MKNPRGSASAIKEIIKLGRGIQVQEMVELSRLAESAGGSVSSIDPDGDWCGTGKIRFKWPPKRNEFAGFLDKLVDSRINFEVLINGIPVPDEILINASRRIGR